jgi:hypothetical protein
LSVTAPPAAEYASTFSVGSSGGSGSGAVTFSVAGVCTISGAVVTMTSGTGLCEVTGTKAGTADYLPAISGPAVVTATRIAQAAVTVEGAPATATYEANFSVSTTGGSGTGGGLGGEVLVTGSCTSQGSQITMTSGTGTCSITTIRPGDDNYLDATASVTVTAAKAAQAVLTVTGVPATAADGSSFTAGTAGGNGTGAVSFTASGACIVNGAIITMTAASGTCSVTAIKAADANYLAASASASAGAISGTIITRTGFHEPVNSDPSVVNTVRGGSTVPLKFNVFVNGIEKTDISALVFTVAQIPCGGGIEEPLELNTTGNTSLRYDAQAGQFIQNWKTPNSSGSCYIVRMTTTGDGGSLTAQFKLK